MVSGGSVAVGGPTQVNDNASGLVIASLTTFAAIGGFLFGYDTGGCTCCLPYEPRKA